MTPLAHAGHWYHSLLYAVPIVLIALALWWSGRREARRRKQRGVGDGDCGPAPGDGPGAA